MADSDFPKHTPTASSFSRFSEEYNSFLNDLEAQTGITEEGLNSIFLDFRDAFFLGRNGEYAWPEDYTNIFDTLQVIAQEIVPSFVKEMGSRPKFGIVSGFRPARYNDKVGGSEDSKHKSFEALDVTLRKRQEFTKFKEITDIVYQQRGDMGFGIYDHSRMNTPFCHLDISNTRRPYTWIEVIEGDDEDNKDRPAGIIAPPVDTQSTRSEPMETEGIEKPDQKNPKSIIDTQPEHQERDEVNLEGSTLQDYITPEERRKGIIARMYPLEEWYMNHVNKLEDEDMKDDEGGGIIGGLREKAEEGVEATKTAWENIEDEGGRTFQGNKLRGDIGQASARTLYIRSLVTAEFWRRRYRSRSVQAASGPFNPNPVSGFPGLIMTPDRPIIGMIQSVSHQINVSGGQARTSISMRSPRYWDEGDPWYYFGGWSEDDHDAVTGEGHLEHQKFYRKFPYWHNRYAMPTNSIDPSGEPRKTNLDAMYEYLIGSEAIDYESIHSDAVIDDGEMNYGKMRKALEERDFADDLELNEETLAIKDYNRLIAETDENGRFKEGTLAHRFWGPVKPFDVTERGTAPDFENDRQDFIERTGVSETDLLTEFLDNEPRRYQQHLVYIGETFENDGKELNPIQEQVIDYIEDVEKRDIQGGVFEDSS